MDCLLHWEETFSFCKNFTKIKEVTDLKIIDNFDSK